MKRYSISILLCFIFMASCSWFEPDTRIYDASTTINIDLTLLFVPDTTSGIVTKDGENPHVIFYGKIINSKSQQPEQGVTVRIEGTDTPGGNTLSLQDGSWSITLPIVPERNDENTTLFAIELKKAGAVIVPIREYCTDLTVWRLLGVDLNNPDSYLVSGVYSRSLPWGKLYQKIENQLYITMKDK